MNEQRVAGHRFPRCECPLLSPAARLAYASRAAGPVSGAQVGFRASDFVHDEWIAALLRNRSDLTAARLQRTRRLMNEHLEGAPVTGFESITYQLPLHAGDFL